MYKQEAAEIIIKETYTISREIFSQLLVEHLSWCNTEKPNKSIGKKAPLRYYLDKFITDPEKSNMHWMLTNIIVNDYMILGTICT